MNYIFLLTKGNQIFILLFLKKGFYFFIFFINKGFALASTYPHMQ